MDLIPEELLRAHEDGRVVFFCGAGVSIPAGLPSFKSLVYKVLSGSIPEQKKCTNGSIENLAWKAFEENKFDEALNILEQPQQGMYESREIRKKIQTELTIKRSKTLENHTNLIRLADLDAGIGRLVTTNFDDLFERALKKTKNKKYTVSISPSLPPAKPTNCKGLIYLHGKLDHSHDNKELVLTSADFGTAYLLEGWARRFVIELFRNYQVIFIGYKVEDPTMQYLVSALAATRNENKLFNKAYAFAEYGTEEGIPDDKESANQEWELKGITALAYNAQNNHQQLWAGIKEWADDFKQGIHAKKQTVLILGKRPPLDDDKEMLQKMSWALKDENTAKFFADLSGNDRPDPGWIDPLQKNGMFSFPVNCASSCSNSTDPKDMVHLISNRLSGQFGLNEITFQLARWLSSCLEEASTLEVVINGGCVLHYQLRQQIRHSLNNPGDAYPIPRGLVKLWRVLSDDSYAHFLSLKNSQSFINLKNSQSNSVFPLKLFLQLLKPIPIFTKRVSLFDESIENPKLSTDWCNVKIELIGESHQIQNLKKRYISSDKALANISMEITILLKEAMEWLHEFDLASDERDQTYSSLPSISDHKQNKYASGWTYLITLSRDAFDALIKTENEKAALQLVHYWQSLPYPIFRRLALYAASGGHNGTS